MAPVRKNSNPKSGFPENLPDTHIQWDKSREEIWAEMEGRLDRAPETPVRTLHPRMKFALAAAMVILVGLPLFMNSYTRNLSVAPAERATATLPDGSTVRLNAESKISYKPLLWFAVRKVRLEGEAFFEGDHGTHFTVISDAGNTTVVGTSFNIYARNDSYEVTCITGMVKVEGSTSGEEVILKAGQKAEFEGSEKPHIVEAEDAVQVLSWMSHRISLTSVPVGKVFEEIARQYGVTVVIPEELDYIYTGNFDCSIPIESALQTVCKPFNLNYALKSNNEFVISKGQ